MDRFTVASVQMRMRLHASLDDYREDLRRFLRAADAKRARLILFPELAGLMLAPLLLRDRRTNLVRRAELGKRRSAGAWDKVSGKAAGWLATALKADLRTSTLALVDLEPQRLWDVYVDTFGGLARSHGVTLVAPSAYLPAAEGTTVVNQAAVFGPDGALLGQQARVLSTPDDSPGVQRGQSWQVIPTEVGRIGLILGTDALYPEVGRLLAYQNAEMLLVQGACATQAAYQKLRAGILARMQDNQLYAAGSFSVGESPLRPGQEPFVGKSVVFAPQELTPKSNGVLVEMGSTQSEGVVTAEWDFTVLRRLWEVSDTPLRRSLDPELAAPLLAALFTQLRALPQARAIELLPPVREGEASEFAPEGAAAAQPDAVLIELEDLPLLGSVSSRWPLPDADAANAGALDAGALDAGMESEAAGMAENHTNGARTWHEGAPLPGPEQSYTAAASSATIRREDETDEMDAVEGRQEAQAEQEAQEDAQQEGRPAE